MRVLLPAEEIPLSGEAGENLADEVEKVQPALARAIRAAATGEIAPSPEERSLLGQAVDLILASLLKAEEQDLRGELEHLREALHLHEQS